MDEDSDVDKELDNSLVDLHHGLDSSTEENRPDDEDVDIGNDAQSMKLPAQHVNMLEEMVQEMRQGLQAAVEELAKLQDRGDEERGRKFQEQQQRQLDDLTENVHEMKSQLNSVMKCMEVIQKENNKLKEDYIALQNDMKEFKGHGAFHQPDQSLEWIGDKFIENPFERENEEEESTYRSSGTKANDEVTAVACKSLSLTQALGENCLHLNLSISSEDGDEPETRRLSHITPSTAQQKDDTNRRHSLPASTTPRGSRSDDIAKAAHRRKAVKELIDSECDYCSQLWTLIETYFTSLQTAAFLTPGQLDILFPSYLEKLYEQHCVICSSLQDKLVHWSYLTVVSDLLSCITDSHNPFSLLSLYREYSENLPDAVSCLKSALTHSSELKAFLKTIEQSSCQSDDLMTLIKAPAQHLPKYLLQLQQICKYTPSTHPDYLLLRTSLSRLRLFVEQINVGMNNAMQTTSQDQQASSNDSSQVLSARDSGNQSNEDDLMSARTLFKSEQCLVSDEWHDDPYHNTHHHQVAPVSYYGRRSQGALPRSLGANFSTLSHPDLTVINSSPMPNSATFSLPPTGLGHSWRNGMDGNGMRHTNRTKQQMKRMHIQPEPFSVHDPNHHLSVPRPSSAIDFTSHYNAYHFNQYPGTNYHRPHSAMGPVDIQHRPNIISRKHMRRSQPPLSSSGYWADIDLQHSKHTHHKMPFSAHDLLPSRPSPLLPHNSQENDEEDDTRASDSFSFMTNSSHRHSSGHSSNNGRDLDLDFRPLASDSNSYHPSRSKQFSEDDVAARLAQELLSDDNDGKELITADIPDRISNAGLLQTEYGHQNNFNPKIDDIEKKMLGSNKSSPNGLQSKRDETMNELPTRLMREENNMVTNKHSLPQQDAKTRDKEQDAKVLNHNGDSRQRILKISPPKPSDTNFQQENNRHFLLSLTHSPRSKKGSSDSPSSYRDPGQEASQTSQSQTPLSQHKSEETDKKPSELHSQNSRPKVVRRSAPSLVSYTQNGSHPSPGHVQTKVSTSNCANDSLKSGHDTSVTSATPRSSLNIPHSTAAPFEMSSERKERSVDVEDANDAKNLMTRSFDLSEVLSEDSKDKIQAKRKKLKNGSTDCLPKASDDPVNARKKMHLKSSIKNLFSKKRGKVILADVEKEVILEMASTVMTASTKSMSTSISLSSEVATSCPTSCPTDKHMNKVPLFFIDKTLSVTTPMMVKGTPEQRNKQSIPPAFEIKWKKEKGSSTSSPVKGLRQLNGIQCTENPTKPLHMLTLVSDHSAQSPCAYQEKLFKERLNIQSNPHLEQKSLIHPKFLLSTKTVKDEGNTTQSNSTVINHSSPTNIIKSSSSKANIYPLSQPLLMMPKYPLDEGCGGIEDGFHKKINKYKESAMKCSKTKRKGYAHMRKYCLNFETQEAEMKEKEELNKKNQVKIKTLKQKDDCPKCHNKSSENVKEQIPGRSFHIQAYKAYKNKHKESYIDDKKGSETVHQGQRVIQDQIAITSSCMDFLKPCEDAIVFYETSNNPKMTNSYPMVSEDRKLRRRSFPSKELNKGIVSHDSTQQFAPTRFDPPHCSSNSNGCQPLMNSIEKNILSFSSGLSAHPDYCQLKNISHTNSNITSTNDLSHPTCKPLSFDATNILSKGYPYSLNVPASKCFNITSASSSGHQNTRTSHVSSANLLRMSKEDFFRFKDNCTFPKKPDVKTESNLEESLKQNTSKPNGNKDCAIFSDKNSKTQQVDSAQLKQRNKCTAEDSNEKEEGLEELTILKEDKDYFDCKYRLCYVDGNKFEADLNQCGTSSAQDKEAEKKSKNDGKSNHNNYKNRSPQNITFDANLSSKVNKGDKSSDEKGFEIDKSFTKSHERPMKSSPENAFTSDENSFLPIKRSKEKYLSSDDPWKFHPICHTTPQKSNISNSLVSKDLACSFFSQSKQGDGCRESSCHLSHGQNRHTDCSFHSEAACQPLTYKNRYNPRNITSETFSSRMTQPIFSVLPFEQYSVSGQANGGVLSDKSRETQNTCIAGSDFTKSHDATRRVSKQRVKSSDCSRHSSSSIQSANEIHILQLNDLSDIQPTLSVSSENQSGDHIKGNQSSNKNADTLQVRYIPKPGGFKRQNKVQTTAHAQINKDSIINGTSILPAPSPFADGSLTNPSNEIKQNIQSPTPSLSHCPYAYDQNGLSASALSSPDLLQVSVIQPGSSRKSESSRSGQVLSPPKKQSFFSRFAHSPLSIFYKDAKSNGSKS